DGAPRRYLATRCRGGDLVLERETRSADRADPQPYLEIVAEMRRRAVVAFRARDDHARVRRRTAGHLAPERQAALLEVREVHRVVDVAHRVAVAETDREAMPIDPGARLARVGHRGRIPDDRGPPDHHARNLHHRRTTRARPVLHERRPARL